MASPLTNTLNVWHSLFLRESLDRFFGSRAAWIWLILEPASHILIIGWFVSFFKRRGSGGVDVTLWITIGLLAFFLFRRTAIQTLHAVDCNKAFFAFRQVRPFDSALVRGGLEAFAMFFVGIAIMLPLAFFKDNIIPSDPLVFICAIAGMWLFGMGFGLITSVIMRLIPDSGHIIQLTMTPLYFISGVMIPVDVVPVMYRDYLLSNPLVHGIEYARHSFFDTYPLIHGASLNYLYASSLVLIFIGLALYKLFDTRLLTR